MKVYIVRHGESEANQHNLWTGWLDVPLTEKGREDATRAGDFLSALTFDRVYASDLQRAKHTAEIALSGCQYETSPLLREVNVGSLMGKGHDAVLDQNGQPLNKNGYAVFGGESTEDFEARVKEFMAVLEKDPCERVAVFSHAGFLRTFLDVVLGMRLPRKTVFCRNCAVGIFDYDGKTWRLDSWINLT